MKQYWIQNLTETGVCDVIDTMKKGRMKIKWESNNLVKSLASMGKIKHEDIIPRTTTDKFPADTATVRLAKVNEKKPFVTVHIRGKSKQRTNSWNNFTYECAETCRVNLGGGYNNGMSSNGGLDEDLNWMDVHNVVEEVKEALNG